MNFPQKIYKLRKTNRAKLTYFSLVLREREEKKTQIFRTQDLELSEDFLTTILKYVDDLCDIISNGDPNVERKVEVIQNLNNDVTCYR